MEITNLKGYTVTVPARWTANAGYGLFDVNGTVSYTASGSEVYYENYQFDTLNIGYFRTSPSDETVSFANTGYECSTSPDYSFTLTFTGGDTSNTSLIQWLVDNDADFTASPPTPPPTPSTPSIIRGNPVENATAYNLYEKVTTGETVEYVFKATNTEIYFDLRIFDLSAGEHEFVVQATAPGYESSDYSEEVTYTAGGVAELISFTIAGETYQAENGMTWAEWVANTTYNTGGYKLDSSYWKYVYRGDIEGTFYAISKANPDNTGSNIVKPDEAIISGYPYGEYMVINSPGGAN